jgi:hypothetical protein
MFSLFVGGITHIVSTPRVGSLDHSDQEPAYRRGIGYPACTNASRLWQAVTPDPQYTTAFAADLPSRRIWISLLSTSTDLKAPDSSRFSPQWRFSAPGMCPAIGSMGSSSPRYLSWARVSSNKIHILKIPTQLI